MSDDLHFVHMYYFVSENLHFLKIMSVYNIIIILILLCHLIGLWYESNTFNISLTYTLKCIYIKSVKLRLALSIEKTLLDFYNRIQKLGICLLTVPHVCFAVGLLSWHVHQPGGGGFNGPLLECWLGVMYKTEVVFSKKKTVKWT